MDDWYEGRRMRLARNSNLGFVKGLSALLIVFMTMIVPPTRASNLFWIEKATTQQRYRFDTLREYAFIYVDRDLVFTSVPSCLVNSRYIATANSDKFSRGPFLLTIRSEVPSVVYVAYDQRYQTEPDWLRRKFRLVSNLLLTVGAPKLGKSQVIFKLYRAEFSRGRISLGGNLADTETSNFAMYTAIFVEAPQDRCR